MSRMPYRVRLSRCTLECVVVESLVPRCPASGVFSLAPERLWLIEIAAATHGVDGAPGLGPWLPTGRVGRMKEWSQGLAATNVQDHHRRWVGGGLGLGARPVRHPGGVAAVAINLDRDPSVLRAGTYAR